MKTETQNQTNNSANNSATAASAPSTKRRRMRRTRCTPTLNLNPNLNLSSSSASSAPSALKQNPSNEPHATCTQSDHDSRSERLSSGTTLVAGVGSQIKNQKSETAVPNPVHPVNPVQKSSSRRHRMRRRVSNQKSEIKNQFCSARLLLRFL
jgi:hypothetical protein